MSPQAAVWIWMGILLGPPALLWLIFLIGGDPDE